MSRTPSLTLAHWLGTVPDAYRSAAALAAVFTAALVTSLALTDWQRLPGRVAAAERQNAAQDTAIARLSSAVSGLEETSRAQLCLSVAERAGTDWRSCFLPDRAPQSVAPAGGPR